VKPSNTASKKGIISLSNSPVPTHKGFLLKIPLFIHFNDFENYLNNQDIAIQLPLSSDKMQFTDFALGSKGDSLLISTNYTSSGLNGKLFISGIPVFDKNTNKIGLTKVRFFSKSNRKSFDKLLHLVENNSGVFNDIKEKLSYDISDQKSQVVFDLTQFIKEQQPNNYTRFGGYVRDITVTNLSHQNGFFVFKTTFSGQLACNIKYINL